MGRKTYTIVQVSPRRWDVLDQNGVYIARRYSLGYAVELVAYFYLGQYVYAHDSWFARVVRGS